VLGIQPYPVLIEVGAWFVYLVPLMVYLLWPQGGPARQVPAEEPSPASAG
jgi:high-affinity iron transporter